jgi:hypothetical protein
MHQPYEQIWKRLADFKVQYRFYGPEEGGRTHLSYQGIRSDFWYEHPENIENSVYMIWPEFENEKGEIILENNKPVSASGTARMWILIPEGRKIHQQRLKVGTKGYFKEGTKSTAECEVIEILGLFENPIK